MKNKRLVILLIAAAIIVFVGYLISSRGIRFSNVTVADPSYNASGHPIPLNFLAGGSFYWTVYLTPEHNFHATLKSSSSHGTLTCPGTLSYSAHYDINTYKRTVGNVFEYDFANRVGTDKAACDAIAAYLNANQAVCPWPPGYHGKEQCPLPCTKSEVSSCQAFCTPISQGSKKHQLNVFVYESITCSTAGDDD